MALHKLEITVIDGGKATGGLTDDNTEEDPAKIKLAKWKGSAAYKMINYNQSIRAKIAQNTSSPAEAFFVESSIGLAVQTARQGINYLASDIGRKNGDSNYQAIVNRRIEVASDIMSVGAGALSGAAAGSSIGPAGAIIGGIAGAASAGISIGFRQAERERTYQHEMFKEGNSQAYNLSRANYSALTGRVR
jgi:hypothetical protein